MGKLGELRVWLFGEKKAERGEWGRMWAKLYVLIPTKVLDWLEEGQKQHKKHPLLYIMSGLIMVLAVSSMWNFIERAYIHHPGINSWLSAGLAGLVPVTVFFAVYVEMAKWQKAVVWAIAIVFAFISASIQFPVYAGDRLTLAYLFSDKFDLEAFAFGAGNPIAECFLAVMEGIYLNNLAKREVEEAAKLAEEAEIEALAQQEAEEAAKLETKRLQEEAEQRERNRLLFVEEQERKRREFELDLELKKAEALAKIEREKIKTEAKVGNQPMRSVQKSATESAVKSATADGDRGIGLAMLDIYKGEPEISDEKIANRLGKSKKKVQDVLADLAAKEVVYIERKSKGKIVTVNGKEMAYREGVI